MFSSTKKCLFIKGEKHHWKDSFGIQYILPSIIHLCLNAYLREGDLIRLQYVGEKNSHYILESIQAALLDSRWNQG